MALVSTELTDYLDFTAPARGRGPPPPAPPPRRHPSVLTDAGLAEFPDIVVAEPM
jgi:hypothetical protein